MLFVFVLATFIGHGRYPPRVASPLHAADVADQRHFRHRGRGLDHRHRIGLSGAIRLLGAVALFASMTNIVSGFLITDRMLKMFKTSQPRDGGKPK